MRELRMLKAAFSFDAVKQLSHSMAGSAGMFGAEEVHQIAMELQQACIDCHEEDAMRLLDALSLASKQAGEAFRRRVEIDSHS